MPTQKIGDVCEECKPRWERKKIEPQVLVAASGKTEVKGEVVPLCPWCDGNAVKVSELGNHDGLEPA